MKQGHLTSLTRELRPVRALSGVLFLVLVGCVGDTSRYLPATVDDVDAGEDRAGGSVAFRDVTGRFTEPTREQTAARVGVAVPDVEPRAGLREEAGPSAGGGIRVRLQGRFASELVAVREEDGTIRIAHAVQPATGGPESGVES